jgi:hypothetical protein
MNKGVCIILVLVVSTAAFAAAPDPHEAQVNAAVGDAVNRMRQDIETQPLSQDLTVADFLHQTGGRDELVQALHKADQIGGPRWIDGDTCQVKLTIDSQRVRDALVKIADESGRRSPLPPDALAAKLQVWNDRTFTATGTSISAQRAQILRPLDPHGPWSTVTDASRRKAIAEARDNAADRELESVGSVQISDGKTVDQVLADKNLRDEVHGWIAHAPVTRLEFKNDLSIEITLAADPHTLFDVFVDMAGKSGALPADSMKLAKARQQFIEQAAPAVGSARVSGEVNAAAAHGAHMPAEAPAWLNEALNSDATAKFKDTRLKTARDAENAARDALRQKVDALQVNNITIAQAAKRDPAFGHAVDQAMDRAHAYKIDYLPDGSVSVKVSLDPRDLWDELRELP